LVRSAALNCTELEVTTTVAGREPRHAHLSPTEAGAIVESALSARQPEIRPVVVSGELYKVDIHSGRFRIEDDLGSSIELIVTGEPAAVAGLVGGRVEVRGGAEYDPNGRLLRVSNATVAASATHFEASSFRMSVSIEELLANAEPFDAFEGGIEGLDDEEIEAFMATIRK